MGTDLVVNRSENKYIIDVVTAERIKQKLNILLSSDTHSSSGGYIVRSLYFDTPNQNDVFDKLDGLEKGHKIRIRTYDPDANNCKIELKSKCGVYRQKQSVLISRTEAEQIIAGDYSCLLKKGSDAALHIYLLISTGAYRPVVLIEYDRQAWYYPLNDTRITFDSKVRGLEYYQNLFDKNPPYMSYGMNSVILEVKFNGILPLFISHILEEFNLEQISISKYTTARPIISYFLEGV